MDVMITGKALTPISHERLFHVPHMNRESNWTTKTMPYSSRYADLKSMQICNNEMKHEQYLSHYDPITERTRMKLTPIFRNMTLSETYSFARAQLNQMPVQNYKRRNARTPTLTFPKVEHSSWDQQTGKNFEQLQSDVLVASCKNETRGKSLTAPSTMDSESYSQKGQHRTKSVIGHRRHRKKSGKRKKKSPAAIRFTQIEARSSKLANDNGTSPIRTSTSPIRTSTSLPSKLKAYTGTQKDSTDQSHLNVMRQRMKHVRPTVRGNRESTVHTGQSSRKNTVNYEVDDLLLSSFDSSLNKTKGSRELSMRIQLIHRYGNEDVIEKHVEMKKRKEMANRHEVKVLEHQANERRKEKQRSKIYALNKLMTRLEQEQFEEYKQRL